MIKDETSEREEMTAVEVDVELKAKMKINVSASVPAILRWSFWLQNLMESRRLGGLEVVKLGRVSVLSSKKLHADGNKRSALFQINSRITVFVQQSFECTMFEARLLSSYRCRHDDLGSSVTQSAALWELFAGFPISCKFTGARCMCSPNEARIKMLIRILRESTTIL